MNKKASIQQSETEGGGMINNVPSRSSSVKKRTIILVGGACLIIILSSAGALYALHVKTVASEKLDRNKIVALINANNCTDGAMHSIAAEKPSLKQVDISLLLLMYRASCYEQHGQYQQAIATYTEQKSYYKFKHNDSMVSAMDEAIQTDRLNISAQKTVVQHTGSPSQDPTLIGSPLKGSAQQ